MSILTNEQLTKLVIELGQRVAALEAKQPQKRFKKPEQVEIGQYMCEKGCQDWLAEADRFFNYYESNGWKVGKNPMKSWKSAVNNWLKNNYKQPNKSDRNAVSAAMRNINDTSW